MEDDLPAGRLSVEGSREPKTLSEQLALELSILQAGFREREKETEVRPDHDPADDVAEKGEPEN